VLVNLIGLVKIHSLWVICTFHVSVRHPVGSNADVAAHQQVSDSRPHATFIEGRLEKLRTRQSRRKIVFEVNNRRERRPRAGRAGMVLPNPKLLAGNQRIGQWYCRPGRFWEMAWKTVNNDRAVDVDRRTRHIASDVDRLRASVKPGEKRRR
jgi:hypothetical protein